MWAEHNVSTKLLTFLSTQWQLHLLERCGQLFFGGIFDNCVGMLFGARRNEDGNVHRRDGVSKTVTKNMWAGSFFKNQKIKERPKTAPNGATCLPCLTARQATRQEDLTADSTVWFCLIKISADVSDRWSPLMESESFRFALLTMLSGFRSDGLNSPNPLSDGLTVPIGRLSERQTGDPTRSDTRLTLTSNASQWADENLTIFSRKHSLRSFCSN